LTVSKWQSTPAAVRNRAGYGKLYTAIDTKLQNNDGHVIEIVKADAKAAPYVQTSISARHLETWSLAG
jgi:hypothetical protein